MRKNPICVFRVTAYEIRNPQASFSDLPNVKTGNATRVTFALCRVLVVGDNCVAEVGRGRHRCGRDKRYHVCAGAHNFDDAGELIRKHQPDILLIEPFLEGSGRHPVDQRYRD